MGIPAALFCKGSTVLCSPVALYKALPYVYPRSPMVQGMYPMDIQAALLYKDSIQWVS